MERKRYEVKGMMEWHPEFRVGRGRLQVSFTGGHLCGGACTPASYETSDPVVQKVIESSAAFLTGRIRLHGASAYGAGASRRSVSVPAAAGHASGLTVMEFDDLEKASDFLQKEKKIPIDKVYTLEQCVKEAAAIGIELKIKK